MAACLVLAAWADDGAREASMQARQAPGGPVLPTGSSAASVTAPVQASPAPQAPAAAQGTCTLAGRVTVLPRKAGGTAKGSYTGAPGDRPEPPDPPASVVWMEGGFPAVDSSKAEPVRLEQQGLQFRPAVLVVRTGTPVVFPNRDPIYHSVFSYSEAKKFDLGRYRPGEEPPAVVFDRPGTITLFCEVHDHMRGAIVVVDTPHFAKTDAEGNFRIEGLPAGTHTFRVWLSPKQSEQRTIELKPGAVTAVDWTKPA